MDLIDLLSVSSQMRKFDCFVLAVLSHGDSNGTVCSVEFKDRESVNIEDILTKFNNLTCKNLVGKPKVFLFPFCRCVLKFDNKIYRNRELNNIT